jgi:hypothetical protein
VDLYRARKGVGLLRGSRLKGRAIPQGNLVQSVSRTYHPRSLEVEPDVSSKWQRSDQPVVTRIGNVSWV